MSIKMLIDRLKALTVTAIKMNLISDTAADVLPVSLSLCAF